MEPQQIASLNPADFINDLWQRNPHKRRPVNFIKLLPKKYPTPLHKRLKKIEREYEALEKDYEERYSKWFAEGKGPRPIKPRLKMERLEKRAMKLMQKLGVNMDEVPPDILEQQSKQPSRLVGQEEVSMIEKPPGEKGIETIGDINVIRDIHRTKTGS